VIELGYETGDGSINDDSKKMLIPRSGPYIAEAAFVIVAIRLFAADPYRAVQR
jgi:hypothetical protein